MGLQEILGKLTGRAAEPARSPAPSPSPAASAALAPAPPATAASRLEFEPQTLPWLDRVYAEIDAYVDSVPAEQHGEPNLRDALVGWMRRGYHLLPGAIEPALVDAFLEDLAELRRTRQDHSIGVMAEGFGLQPIRELPEEAFAQRHLRYIDFHNSSIAAKRIMLHPRLVRFLGHLFRSEVVAMQSLTFVHGSEQWMHQDYAYVQSGIPSHLAAAWVALEDVHADAGPLAYFDGSHAIRKFDWGPPAHLLYSCESRFSELDFRDHIERECGAAGLPHQVVLARKGDVFLWHGALAHSGSPSKDPERTRRAFVVHYSTPQAYPCDRRAPGQPPRRQAHGGGWVYENPLLPGEEDVFRRGAEVGPGSMPLSSS